MKVKGTWMVDIVRLVRSNRDKDYAKWLEPEDWDIINGTVLSSVWYPFESYKRVGLAAYKVVSGSDLNLTRLFGRTTMQGLVQVYKNMVAPGDPAASVQKFCNLAQNFFRGVQTHYEVHGMGPGWIEVKLNIAPEDGLEELGDVFGYQIAGALDEMIQLTGVADGRIELKKTADGYDYRITWK
jgi:hypothetical protein